MAKSLPLTSDNTVTFCGWAHRRRDHGGVIFIDLRDRYGLVQIVCDPDMGEDFKRAEEVRHEFVLRISGLVRARPEGTVNPNLPTGEIEVLAKQIEILNAAATPPFLIDDDTINENIRLTYRYLDLRREPMQKNMALRYRMAKSMRDYLDSHGFMEVETPMLTRSTPEGARDYLVPSRRARRHVLCAAAVAAVVQAAADGGGLRPLFPDHQMLPR